MIRRLHIIFFVLWLLLGLATICLWVRSYWAGDCIWWSRMTFEEGCLRKRDLHLITVRGGISLRHHHGVFTAALHEQMIVSQHHESRWYLSHTACDPRHPFDDIGGPASIWERLGFFLNPHMIIVPYWCLGLLFVCVSVPALRWRYIRASRARRGLCPTCGYDLRASRERCPECGTPVLTKPVSCFQRRNA